MEGTKLNKKTVGILMISLLVSCLFIFKDYILGDKMLVFTDIGSDTYDQYMMYYQSVINHLRNGDFSFWDFTNGAGTGMFVMVLFNPFLMLLYGMGALFGPDKIYGIILWLQILQILLGGLAIYTFLSCFQLPEKGKLPASYVYALCGYMIVWGQHYHFASVVVFFPLTLTMAEKALRKTKWLLGLTILCTVCCVNSLYTGYMQMLTVGFYILFRVAWEERLFCRHGLLKVGKAYGSMILGIGMGLFSLLPSAISIFAVSRRMSGGDDLIARLLCYLQPYEFSYYKTLMKRFLSSNLDGINQYTGYQNFYEDPNVFLSTLFLLVAVQFACFFLMQKGKRKQKLLLLTVVLLCGFVFLIPAGSLVFNGFAAPFCRYTFLCMPFFVWIMAKGMQEIMDRHKVYRGVLIASAVVIILEYLRIYKGENRPLALLFAVLTAVMAAGLWGLAYWRERRVGMLAQTLLTAGLVIMMSMDAYWANNMGRLTLTKSDTAYMEELYDGSVQEALAYLAETDDSFYRVEKDYTVGTETSCLNALAQNYRSVSTYNSTLNGSLYQMVNTLWPNLQIVNDAHYSFANAVNDNFQASLFHVKYVLSKKDDLHVQGYELLKQFGDVYLYRNRNTEQFAKFYSSAVAASDFEAAKERLNTEALLSDAVIYDGTELQMIDQEKLGEYEKVLLAQDEQISEEREENSAYSAITLGIPAMEGSQTEKYMLEFDLSVAVPAYDIAVTVGNHITKLVASPTPTHVAVSVPGDVEEVKIQHNSTFASEAVISNKRLYRYTVADLSGNSEGIRVISGKNDGNIQISAVADRDGMLMAAIPYEIGWHAYVDGTEVDICKVDYGFCGILLSEGAYEVEMIYRCPGLRAGAALSVCFLLLTAAIWAVYCKKADKKED